jgi:hypothetical protein
VLNPSYEFPDNRENNREFLEISHDSGLLARFWEPTAKPIQQLAANSLFLRKQRMFLPEQGVRPTEQGIAYPASRGPTARP